MPSIQLHAYAPTYTHTHKCIRTHNKIRNKIDDKID